MDIYAVVCRQAHNMGSKNECRWPCHPVGMKYPALPPDFSISNVSVIDGASIFVQSFG
jgi:hypothetical protein